MSYSIITADKFKTINWTGGTSTQLYIYPETSDYALRNFDFRLSTAKVEIEKSDFTPLPGVSRKIMILDGEIQISHKNHYTKKLQKFDIDKFEGDWQTSSVGICRDFNLMTKGQIKGELSSINLLKEQAASLPLTDKNSKILIYIHSGSIRFTIEGDNHKLNQADLLILDKPIMNDIKFIANQESRLIISKILF